MGSQEEGGYLKVYSTRYTALVAAVSLKNTQHTGKGIYLAAGRLFLNLGTRLIAMTVSAHLPVMCV